MFFEELVARFYGKVGSGFMGRSNVPLHNSSFFRDERNIPIGVRGLQFRVGLDSLGEVNRDRADLRMRHVCRLPVQDEKN